MNCLSRFSLWRLLGVMVLIAAWFAMSNHCALAMLGGMAATAPATQCCSSETTGGQEPNERPADSCCKQLRVLPQEAVVKLVKAPDAPLLPPPAWAEIAETRAPESSTRAVAAPAESRTFAEVVLQRSLQC